MTLKNPMKPLANSGSRVAERFAVAMPVVLEHGEGATHDLSSTGVLFESAIAPKVGAWVDLTLKYLNEGEPFDLRCRGKVVRVETVGDGYNVAVRLSEPLFPDRIRLDPSPPR